MDVVLLQEIYERLFDRLKKADTNFRKALSPGLKLVIIYGYGGQQPLSHVYVQGSTVVSKCIMVNFFNIKFD